jgi:hypothetical protein
MASTSLRLPEAVAMRPAQGTLPQPCWRLDLWPCSACANINKARHGQNKAKLWMDRANSDISKRNTVPVVFGLYILCALSPHKNTTTFANKRLEHGSPAQLAAGARHAPGNQAGCSVARCQPARECRVHQVKDIYCGLCLCRLRVSGWLDGREMCGYVAQNLKRLWLRGRVSDPCMPLVPDEE